MKRLLWYRIAFVSDDLLLVLQLRLCGTPKNLINTQSRSQNNPPTFSVAFMIASAYRCSCRSIILGMAVFTISSSARLISNPLLPSPAAAVIFQSNSCAPVSSVRTISSPNVRANNINSMFTNPAYFFSSTLSAARLSSRLIRALFSSRSSVSGSAV